MPKPFALVVSLPGRLHVHASSMADAAELASAQLAKEAPTAILPGAWTVERVSHKAVPEDPYYPRARYER